MNGKRKVVMWVFIVACIICLLIPFIMHAVPGFRSPGKARDFWIVGYILIFLMSGGLWFSFDNKK